LAAGVVGALSHQRPPPIGGITYDASGNLTGWTTGSTTTTTLKWDSADRNTTIQTTGPDPASITYTRDATDRIIRRDATGDTITSVLYGYTGSGDNADLTLGADKRLLSRTIALPGGVIYTKPGAGGQPEQWDHPSVRGDLVLTSNASGQQVGALHTYTPYGDPLTTTGTVNTDNVPNNQPGQMDYGWLGQHQRPYERAGAIAVVQMGARPYLPLFGRFLSVDPVDGGSANDYDYVAGDPINNLDLDGSICFFCPAIPFMLRVGAPLIRKGVTWLARKGIPWLVRKGIPRAAKAVRGAAKAVGGAFKGAFNWVRKQYGRVKQQVDRKLRRIPVVGRAAAWWWRKPMFFKVSVGLLWRIPSSSPSCRHYRPRRC
jgi:RHS repeat-associated protein